ncbi:MAG TPA: MFS transporter [Phenylobacterium sp.]|nr:MFS transporter [Phenylobacterium sp.]
MAEVQATPTRAAGSGYPVYVVALLCAVLALSYIDRLTLSVLVQPIKHDLKLSDTQMGVLGGLAFALFYAAFGLPLARWVDRGSRVRLLSLSVVFWSVAAAASGLAQNFAQLFIARMGTGAGESSCVPAGHSLIAAYVSRERRPFALGMFHAGASLGVIAGTALAGLAAAAYGWRLAFALLGLPGLLVALLVSATIREPARPPLEGPARALWATLLALARRPTFVHVTLAYAAINFGVAALTFWFPAFYQRVHGLTLANVGLAVGLTKGVGGALGMGLGGLLAAPLLLRDPRWAVWYPALGMAACVPLYVAALTVSSADLSLALLFAASVVATIGNATGLAVVHTVTTPQDRGQAVAVVVLFAATLGQSLGPFVVGLLSDVAGSHSGESSLRLGLLTAIIGFALAMGHFFAAARTLARDTVD